MEQSLFSKIWESHRIDTLTQDLDLLAIDRIFLHERTGGVALQNLAANRHRVRHPEQAFCTFDHIVDTLPGRDDNPSMPGGREFIRITRDMSHREGLTLFDLDDPRQGIVHVVAAEQGIALPGCTLVCPDSHSCTLGGIGTLAWGVGSSELEHALATQTLRVRRPSQMRVCCEGQLGPGVRAKDLALHLLQHYGVGGGADCAVEFCGAAITALEVEARFTLCNMAVEFSAFSGLVAPDEKSFAWIKGRPWAPAGEDWERALAHWRELRSDPGAVFDREISIDASAVAPTVTWGVDPGQAVAVDARVPDPGAAGDERQRRRMQRALEYMDLRPGQRLSEIPIDIAFIGSCTNSRLSDLRDAARVLQGQRIAAGVRGICVPGSTRVKCEAEALGLDRVFTDAGFEWRESGCSLCFYAGGERFAPGQRVISSTNRNFEGRQGPGVRTHLASPATVAGSALAGHIAAAPAE